MTDSILKNDTRYFNVHWIRSLIIGVLFLSVLTACQSSDEGEEVAKEEAEPAIPVEAVAVEYGDVTAVYEGTTTLEPDEEATVVAKVSGVALSLSAEEGDFVEQGTVLARLEQDRYRLELQRAAAELNRLENEYQRKQELLGRQLVSQEEYDRARFELDSQKAQHALARLNLDYTTIRAPISGYISERMVKVGNLINVNQSVFRIDSFDPLLAVLHVPEREISVLKMDQEVSLTLDAYPGELFAGQVTRISPVINSSTGTFKVTAEVSDPEGRLKSGLFGRVRVVYESRYGVPVVSRDAVISEDGQHHVFLIGEEEKVTRQEVVLGFENGNKVEIVSGINEGDKVVTAGKGSLREGSLVDVINLDDNAIEEPVLNDPEPTLADSQTG